MKDFFGNNHYAEEAEIVLMKDDRKQVKDTSQPPFRWICSLEVEFPEPVFYTLATLEHPGKSWKDMTPSTKGCGSGLLISPNHVLTASHVIAGLKVVKDAKTGKAQFQLILAKKITIIPGRNEDDQIRPRPFGTWTSKKVMVSSGFRTAMEVPVEQLTKAQVRKALSYDFGVIEIAERADYRPNAPIIPGQTAGWWGELENQRIHAVEGSLLRELRRGKIHIGGYPGEKGRLPCSVPWASFDKVVEAQPTIHGKTENLLLYEADTSAGMSGSPVWMKGKDGQFYLVAVHSSFLDYKAGEGGKVNVGALVDLAMINQLRHWKIWSLEIIF